jgi:hypothetical protein
VAFVISGVYDTPNRGFGGLESIQEFKYMLPVVSSDNGFYLCKLFLTIGDDATIGCGVA